MDTMDQCYRRNDDFVFRRIEDETLLVPIRDNVGDMGSIYSLNEMGAFIWEQLDGQSKLAAVKAKITEAYNVSSQEAEADLSEFLRDLIEIKAVLRVA
jgi:hypothetical protein